MGIKEPHAESMTGLCEFHKKIKTVKSKDSGKELSKEHDEPCIGRKLNMYSMPH